MPYTTHNRYMADNPWLAPLTGFLGVLVGAYLTSRHQEKQRKLEWCQKQLQEFYAPLWAKRLEIQALSEYRLKVSDANSESAADLLTGIEEIPPEKMAKHSERVIQTYLAPDNDYNDKQLREIILPAYREMQLFFRQNLSYAEPSTIDHFITLVTFNEQWKRFVECDIPFDVGLKIRVSEDELKPLYSHLRKKTLELQDAIAHFEVPGSVHRRFRLALVATFNRLGNRERIDSLTNDTSHPLINRKT